MSTAKETLETASHIGIIGDTHGNLGDLVQIAYDMHARGVRVLVVLGDFGFIWPGENWGHNLDRLSNRLAKHGQTVYFVDGNHEWHPRLLAFPADADGQRRVRPNVIHLPRGHRMTIGGRKAAALGGANSIDKGSRAGGHTWWAEESITEDDLTTLDHDPVDILFGHDAPMHVPTLDSRLARSDHYWSDDAVAYSRAGRAMFHRGFLQVRPKLSLSGHYHHHVDEMVTYGHGHGHGHGQFLTRVVVLDMTANRGHSQAILGVATLAIDYVKADGMSIGAD